MLPARLAFVDLETTGANPVQDRITEIGVVIVEGDRVSTWNSLVNPERPIPPFIQRLTGIDDAMVAAAPRFAALADEIEARLAGFTFIAHNARFDYGFLKNEFKRLGRRFQADVVCTVKLSRRLFPEQHRHNLDSLIARHGLAVADRHRALGDAQAIWLFWQQLVATRPAGELEAALLPQRQPPALPPHLDAEVLDDLPECPGVYLLYGEGDGLLYVGKGDNLRRQVLAHFKAGGRGREHRLGQETHRIEWQETVGELGALLLETRLIKARQPAHNRHLRGDAEACAWRLEERGEGDFRPVLVSGDDLHPTAGTDLFGLFASPKEATQALRKIAEAHALCPTVLGLEKPGRTNPACAGHKEHRCRGACVGKEPLGLHSARLMSALARLKLKPWPYPGPIGLVERDPVSERTDIHVLHAWCHLGTARSEADIADILAGTAHPTFDRDIYKVLVRHLDGSPEIIRLP